MTVASKTQLDAAAQAARSRLLTARERTLATLRSLIDTLADDVRAEIARSVAGDGRLTISALPTLRAWLGGRLSTFSNRWQVLLDDGVREAAKIGASLLELVGRIGGDAQVVGQVVETLRTFRAADGLTLSDRIWRVDTGTRDAIYRAVENAIARGESASQATARYLRDGVPVPESVQAGTEAARGGAIGRAIRALLQEGAPGSPDYLIQRVMRTEINRAYTESYVASVTQHPDVIGMRFNLSPQHPRADICDLYASANLYGLGAGVYPPGQHPYPAHPNTISFLTAVFKDEVTDADRAGKQTAFEWIAAHPADMQDQILGSNRKGAAFRAGLLQEGDLRMPWYAIAARLGINDEAAAE